MQNGTGTIELTPPIRNSAYAVIVQDGDILLLRKEGYEDGERYALPGGGQDLGETLEQTLLRECMEEIGAVVVVRDLIHVADCFKPRDTMPPSVRHRVDFLFACTLPPGYTPCIGEHPDKHQVAVVWAGMDRLVRMPLYPRSLAGFLAGASAATYLGTLDW